MGWLTRLLGGDDRRGGADPIPVPVSPTLTRMESGAVVLDFTKLPREAVGGGAALAEGSRMLAAGAPPTARLWVFAADTLRAWARSGAEMAKAIRMMHVATRDAGGIPDAIVLAGDRLGTEGAVYLLRALGLESYAMNEDGSLPYVEARTAMGRLVTGMSGDPLGAKPPDVILRKVQFTRDKRESQADAAADVLEKGRLTTELLDLATKELSYIAKVLVGLPS
jgi:hypothetical protein